MKYDESKIYTAFNADELKQGSKVICANKAHAMRKKITDDADSQILLRIEPENKMYRFVDSTGGRWLYAYLIEEPQEKNYKPFSSMEKAKVD